ncbi:HAD family hydrolase [Streptomyces sp. NPDC093591]|uniref:HAD family hydrolase n=1 Tax=Streptomyces sp. NPDC093591 TaxID=3366044 RepID=UPI003826A811
MGDAIDDQKVLPALLERTKAVLFDFDGPLCSLFGGRPTKDVADAIKETAREHRGWSPLAPEVEYCSDSHDILRRLRDMYETAPARLSALPLKLAEDIVAEAEDKAVETAVPAQDIATLVELLSGLHMRMAVVSNNAEKPIRKFLDRPDIRLGSAFHGVFGRIPGDARLMKPDPHCVERAIAELSLDPAHCLLVGDKLSDFKAARSAGTCFLGYTRKPSRAADMKESGAEAVVSSHQPVIEAARRLHTARRAPLPVR